MLSCQHCDVKNESVDPLLLCEKCVKRLDLLDEAVGFVKLMADRTCESRYQRMPEPRDCEEDGLVCYVCRARAILRKHEELS
jgi:hypothetical protein